MLAEILAIAEYFGNGTGDGNDLLPAHERIQRHGEMRVGGEASGDAERKSDLVVLVAANCAACGGKADVVDLGIDAPGSASGNRDLELTGKIVEISIAGEQVVDLTGERRSIAKFFGIDSGEWASGDIARDIAASTEAVQSHMPQLLEHFGKTLDRDPVELNILADG